MILVNKSLNIDIQRLGADPNGRFVKIRIKNRMDDNSLTLSCAYLEPTGELEDINQIVFDSDIIAGDFNEANTGLNKLGVYHYKGITIEDEFKFNDRKIFDHPIIFGKIKFGTHLKKESDNITIIDKQIIKYNEKVLEQIAKGASQIEKLKDPFKKIQTKNYEQKIDLEKFGEEYTKLKEEIKTKNKEEWKNRYQNLNAILTQNNLNDENWYKINKILLSEQNKKFLKNSEINEKIITDFKNLYGHDEGRKFDINETLNVIYQILKNLKVNSHSFKNEKLYNPKSKAYDFNGFSQRQIINLIKDDEYINQIDKFSYILMLLSNNNSIDKLIHQNIKILFIKKKVEAD